MYSKEQVLSVTEPLREHQNALEEEVKERTRLIYKVITKLKEIERLGAAQLRNGVNQVIQLIAMESAADISLLKCKHKETVRLDSLGTFCKNCLAKKKSDKVSSEQWSLHSVDCTCKTCMSIQNAYYKKFPEQVGLE